MIDENTTMRDLIIKAGVVALHSHTCDESCDDTCNVYVNEKAHHDQ